MAWLGLDLGTSGVKAVLMDEAGAVTGQASAPLDVSRPHPRWSEQDPGAWWIAATQAVSALRRAGHRLDSVRGLGLAGQMHGAVVLDAAARVLRPAILWNDGRSAAECAVLDEAARRIAGNRAMAGFTAPKLLWLRRHEPEIFAVTRRVLLPKDWLRMKLTGEAVSEMSDAAGTLWLDIRGRDWSEEMLGLCGLGREQMPRLVEGNAVSGRLRADVAAAWGLLAGIPVAGGASDNAAGAIGLGCIQPGDAFLSLGTSGVIFVADAAPMPDPDRTVHTFCHALPARWHRMSVILSAAAALTWATRVLGAASEAELLREVEEAGPGDGREVFLPYLAGERTPHDDPNAAGVWFGLEARSTRADLARAVLEGVAFALADGLAALEVKGGRIGRLSVIGGGARSALWRRILAAALNRPLALHRDAEVGPALGAARLARLAAEGGKPEEVCTAQEIQEEVEIGRVHEPAQRRQAIFRTLYPALAPAFSASC